MSARSQTMWSTCADVGSARSAAQSKQRCRWQAGVRRARVEPFITQEAVSWCCMPLGMRARPVSGGVVHRMPPCGVRNQAQAAARPRNMLQSPNGEQEAVPVAAQAMDSHMKCGPNAVRPSTTSLLHRPAHHSKAKQYPNLWRKNPGDRQECFHRRGRGRQNRVFP